MSQTSGSGVVYIENHQIFISSGDIIAAVAGRPTQRFVYGGLLRSLPTAIEVITGMAGGYAPVEVAVSSEDPGMNVAAPWEAVSEASASAELGLLGVQTWHSSPRELSELGYEKHRGWYRVRVHVLGRDLFYDGRGEDLQEKYLIQLWPEDHERAPDVLRAADHTADIYLGGNDQAQQWSPRQY